MTCFRRPLLAALLCFASLGAAAVAQQETVDDVLAPLHPSLLFTSTSDASSSSSSFGGDSASAAVELTASTVPSAVSAASGSTKSCEFEGQRIRHRGAKYLAGRTHKRGSIYGSCVNGRLSCFEDNGIADAPQLKHVEVACSARVIGQRRRKLGVAVRLKEDVWPDGLIWYRLNTTFSAQEKSIIREAIAVYESTDVKISFKECEPASLCKNKYVSFEQNEDACYSYVGYVDDGEPQIVNLGESCFDGPGTAVHEVGHALGLYHEHTHPQREVIILTDSDLPVSASNYAKETDAIFKPYDKGSIMHYGRSAGLCLPKDQYPLKSFCDVEVTTNCVMPVKQHCNTTKSKEIGQRTVLSAGDLNTLKALYGSKTGNNDNSLPVPIPNASSDPDSGSDSGSLTGKTPSPSAAPPAPAPTTEQPSPSPAPTAEQPSPSPSPAPTAKPPTPSPSAEPSPSPSAAPLTSPAPTTKAPTPSLTPPPSTARPTPTPTDAPTEIETEAPATAIPTEAPEPTTTTAPAATPKPAAARPTTSPSTSPVTRVPTSQDNTVSPTTSAPVETLAPATAALTPKVTSKKTSAPAAAVVPNPWSFPVYTLKPVSPYVPGGVHGESSVSGSTSGSNGWWSLNWFTDAKNAVTRWTENVAGDYDDAKTSVKVTKTKTNKKGKTSKTTTKTTTTTGKSASSSSTKSSTKTTTSTQMSNGNGWGAYNSNNGLSFRGAGGN